MVKHGYKELFADDPEWLPRAVSLSQRTFEFTEYLVDNLGTESLGAEYSDIIAYHSSCHLLRDLGIDGQPQRLLDNVEGAEIVPLPKREECCGLASGASVLVSCDAGCIAHISGGFQRKKIPLSAVHIAEILDQQ
jgi:L-lactate dehydrogenase complex protein LldE